MNSLELARWQFGIVTVYHFLFVPVTIGLSFYVAYHQTMWHRTGEGAWLRSTKFWARLPLISFALRTKDQLEGRARAIAAPVAPVAAVVGIVYLAWLLYDRRDRGGIQGVSAVLAVLAALALIAASVLVRISDARAFAASTRAAYSLSIPASASAHYTLVVMTV